MVFARLFPGKITFSYIRGHQVWASISSLNLMVSPSSILVRMSSSSKPPQPMRQDKVVYHQNSPQHEQLRRKAYSRSPMEGMRQTASVGVKTHFNEKKPPWLMSMHMKLMKTVDLPSPLLAKNGSTRYSQNYLQTVSTEELMCMAQGIASVNQHTMKVIVALWRRFGTMTVEEMLTVADIFFLNSVSVPWYTSALLSYADEMFESLSFTPLQLIRLMFHIQHHRTAPPSLLLAIEDRMSEILADFDMSQVAIICQLFFTGKNRIKSPVLVDQIASKLIQEFDTVKASNLPMLMKTMRFSNFIKISFYKELGDRLVSSDYFQHFRIPNQIMHFAFTYASVRITHPELFSYILTHIGKTHTNLRLKDVAKVIWACGTLVTNQPEHTESIYEILEQLRGSSIMKEVKEYPDNLVDMLMGLALLNIYPQDLINMAFDPHIVHILKGLNPEREKFSQLEFLDQSLSIECPQYSGSQLTEADRKVVAQRLKDLSLEVDMQLRKSVGPAVAALENSLGLGFVQCKFVLPHFRTSDILLHYDKENKVFVKPVTDPVTALSTDHGQDSDNKIQRLVLLLLSRAQTTYDGQPLGMVYCKIRQLHTLGYTVITINADEALSYTYLDMETTQKLLLNHISDAVDFDVTTNLGDR